MQTRNLTDKEILEAGYRVLLDKLGPAGFVRFVRLYEPPAGDYLTADKLIDHMSAQEIYDEAARLEADRGKQHRAGR